MIGEIIQIDGQNFIVQENKGAINRIVQNPVPKELTQIPSINTKHFVGRQTDKDAILQLLAGIQKVVLVNGIGGIGKTMLAQAIIGEQKGMFQHLAWIEVIGNTKTSFALNYYLLDSLNIDLDLFRYEEQFIEKVFELMISRLSQMMGNNLLVIDNAQTDIEEEEILKNLALTPNWKILVTSRKGLNGFEVYSLGLLSQRDAKELFYLHYDLEAKAELVDKMIDHLGRHTLGIEVLAKTAQALKLSLEDLWGQMKDRGLNILDHEDAQAYIQFSRGGNKRIQRVFSFLVDLFELSELSAYERWILKQFSVLPSLNIPFKNHNEENIQHFLQVEGIQERTRFTDSLNALVKKGWLNWDEAEDQFKIHQVLQEVIFFRLQPQIVDCRKLIEFFTEKLSYDEIGGNPIPNFRWIK